MRETKALCVTFTARHKVAASGAVSPRPPAASCRATLFCCGFAHETTNTAGGSFVWRSNTNLRCHERALQGESDAKIMDWRPGRGRDK